MKLSFSTKCWRGLSWQELCDTAVDTGMDGIEIHNINNEIFTGKTCPLDREMTSATRRALRTAGLEIPCIDVVSDIADFSKREANITEIRRCAEIARDLGVKYVRLHAVCGEFSPEQMSAFIAGILPYAEENGVVFLIETIGLYCRTDILSSMLDVFASDSLGVLWNMHETFRYGCETPDKTVKNLGAYIRHVRIGDSVITDGKAVRALLGEGDLPVEQMMDALRSLNYDGYVTVEWDPAWDPEIADINIILPHYVNFMSRFESKDPEQKHLYSNRAHTGKFPWKKDALIDCTFPEVLDKMVLEFPDQYAFKYTTLDYTRTYSQFRDDVDTFARALISLGVHAGSHVAIWATNIPQWYITFWAATKIGAVLVTVNTAYKISEAEYLFRQSDTHTIVMIENWRDSNYKEIMKELCPELTASKAGEPLHCRRLPFLRNIITVGFRMPGCLDWDEAVERANDTPVEEVYRLQAAVSRDDVCNMQYTSGTTGFPKGVMLTHHNVVNNGKCIGDRMDLSTADRMMIQVPMFHCFGMVLAMTASMTHGATLMPLPYFSPKPALACINNEHITAFHGVPTMFIAMLENEDFPKTDFSYMRTGIMAGSPCPISKMRDVVEKMHMTEITIVYGETEASPGCTMSSTDDPLDVRVATVGRALPEIECRIVDPETNEQKPDGETGEFVARGYNIMKGYYKMPEATKEAIDRDGWLHTGDLAARNPDGNYRITGRLKDMIIRGGENIYPKEIEEFIYTNPKVKDVQVIGVPDESYGEEIMACVILKEGETMTEDELKAFVRASMAKHKVPRYVDFVTEFPQNAAGKILKYKMREDAVKKLGLQKAASTQTA